MKEPLTIQIIYLFKSPEKQKSYFILLNDENDLSPLNLPFRRLICVQSGLGLGGSEEGSQWD